MHHFATSGGADVNLGKRDANCGSVRLPHLRQYNTWGEFFIASTPFPETNYTQGRKGLERRCEQIEAPAAGIGAGFLSITKALILDAAVEGIRQRFSDLKSAGVRMERVEEEVCRLRNDGTRKPEKDCFFL